MALAESADWPKATLDLPVKSAEELRFFLLNRGWTIEKFKTLTAYKAALASGRYPWLAELGSRASTPIRADDFLELALPPAQPGRCASSSSLAMQRGRIGASRERSANVLDQIEETDELAPRRHLVAGCLIGDGASSSLIRSSRRCSSGFTTGR